MTNSVFIVAAKRTPIGKFLGGLSTIPAPKLGGLAIRGALDSISLAPEAVEEVFMGNVLQSGVGQAPARQAALHAGLADTTPCTTVNKVCASGMKSIILAAQTIALGADVVVAGGMENMSLAPHLSEIRKGQKFGGGELTDSILKDGLTDPYQQVTMGVFADQCATTHDISREAQDDFAITSYQRSAKAWGEGSFNNEVISVTSEGRKPITTERDEEYTEVMLEKIPSLRPAFSKEGTVTAANASTLNDGAAALVLMSDKKMQELELTPLAKINSYADAAHAPEWFTTAPSKALPLAVEKAGIQMKTIDLFEINEAFSVVGIVNNKMLNLDANKVNINGGAVSLGHPIGCSGARIVVTLLHALKQQDKKYGAAGICNGGGGASAMVFERV